MEKTKEEAYRLEILQSCRNMKLTAVFPKQWRTSNLSARYPRRYFRIGMGVSRTFLSGYQKGGWNINGGETSLSHFNFESWPIRITLYFSLPAALNLENVLRKSEELFYLYCRKTVGDCFQVIDELEVEKFKGKRKIVLPKLFESSQPVFSWYQWFLAF